MNRVMNFCLVYASLFLLEVAISFIVLLVSSIFNSINYKANFDGVVLWNLWRVLFYGLPLIIIFFLLFKYISLLKIDYKPILFSFFNLTIYILVSFLSQSIWKNTPLPLEGTMFKVTSIAIFLAPLILGLIPYFRTKFGNL